MFSKKKKDYSKDICKTLVTLQFKKKMKNGYVLLKNQCVLETFSPKTYANLTPGFV